VGVPTSPPCGEEGLGETSREAYSAPGACCLWRLSLYGGWFCRSSAGLGWWAAGVVEIVLQNVGGLNSVRRYGGLPATHDNRKCLVGAGDDSVRAAVWWFQGATCGVLPQEDVGRVPEILVDESGRGCVACCWGWSQLVHVVAELLYEGGCLDLWGGWYQELAADPQGLTINELCCG
jgi:hypothetical protein